VSTIVLHFFSVVSDSSISPASKSALFAVQFQGGGSIGGLLLSGGVDFGFGPGGGYVLFGGEVGFGGGV
jgi:hypothetical protein